MTLAAGLRGIRKINLWQHLPAPELGTVADDWKATGDDLRRTAARHSPCRFHETPQR